MCSLWWSVWSHVFWNTAGVLLHSPHTTTGGSTPSASPQVDRQLLLFLLLEGSCPLLSEDGGGDSSPQYASHRCPGLQPSARWTLADEPEFWRNSVFFFFFSVHDSGALCCFFSLYLYTLLWIYVAVVQRMILSRSSFSSVYFFFCLVLRFYCIFLLEKIMFSHILPSLSLIHLIERKIILAWVILLFKLLSKITSWNTVILHFRSISHFSMLFQDFSSCYPMCQCLYFLCFAGYLSDCFPSSVLHVQDHHRS